MKKMLKIRFLGGACLEFISDQSHIIFDPNYYENPVDGIKAIFLSHEHSDHTDLDHILEIKNKFSGKKNNIQKLKIYAPKPTKEKLIDEGYKDEIIQIQDQKEVNIEDILIKPYKIDCYKAEKCFGYLISINNLNILHTADSANFSKEIKNINEKIDYCFIACFKDYFDNYIDFIKIINPNIVIPYHFSPEKKQDAKDLVDFLKGKSIKAKYYEIGGEIVLN